MDAQRFAEVTLLEVYVFALPFIVLAGGAAVAYFTSRSDADAGRTSAE